VHAETGTLPARGNLRPRDKKRKEAYEKAAGGKRVSRSKEATTACFVALRDHMAADVTIDVQTDEKKSYPPILRRVFGKQVRHQWVSSKVARNRANLIFPINNSLAQARDNVGRARAAQLVSPQARAQPALALVDLHALPQLHPRAHEPLQDEVIRVGGRHRAQTVHGA
jgi:hypothetical protein